MAKSKYLTQEEIDVLHQTMRWPNWPFLPIKRYVEGPRGEQLECCLLIDYNARPVWKEVYGINMFDLVGKSTMQILSTKKYKYATEEELWDDGWVVD